MERAVVASGLLFPESLRWWDGELWFVDGPTVKRLGAGGIVTVDIQLDCPLLLGLARDPGGGYLVGDAFGRRIWAVDQRGRATLFADLAGVTPHMINEVMLLGDGGLIVGDIGFDPLAGEEPKTARLIRVAPDGSVERTGSPMLFANGMVGRNGGTELLVAETIGARIWSYSLANEGGLDAGHVVATKCIGIDGVADAPDATFWYANHTTGDVVHLGIDGIELSRVASGANCATSCVLDDSGASLYVATVPSMPRSDMDLRLDGAIVCITL